MNGIHDMGGMDGFGPIERDPEEPLFHHDWERRVFAIRVASPVPIPGGSRNSIEQMPPDQYLTTSYYEKWLHSRIKGFLDAGVLTQDELEERLAFFRDHPDAPVPRLDEPDQVEPALAKLLTWEPPKRDLPRVPQFQPGETVRVRMIHSPRHSRLPRYAQGKHGTVVRYYGVYDVQDIPPLGETYPPEPMYAVRFDAHELWGGSAEPNSTVCLDMWELYLEKPSGL